MPALSVRTSSNEEFGNLGSGLVGDAAASSRKHFMSEQELAVAAMHVAITHVQVIALGLGRNATVLRTHVVFIENVVQLHSCFLGRDSAQSPRDQRPYQCGHNLGDGCGGDCDRRRLWRSGSRPQPPHSCPHHRYRAYDLLCHRERIAVFSLRA
jgi:hypothetical protein